MHFARKDFFTLNYYKKQPYTASSKGTRLRLTMEMKKENEEDEKGTPVFRLCTWPEPFCYDKTAEELKTYREFPYTEDSIKEIIEFLNETIGDPPKEKEEES